MLCITLAGTPAFGLGEQWMNDESAPGLTGISNIMLGVTDMPRALAFYAETLGLQVRHETPGLAFLDGGAVMLCLSEGLARARPQGPGATEIVFSVADIHASHEALSARGVTFAQPPRLVTNEHYAANFEDPDGHVLSIFGPGNQQE